MSNETRIASYFCLSIWPLDVPKQHSVMFAASQAISCLFTIVSNTVLIYALYKTGQLNTISNKFILTMNLSDLCMGIIGQPMVASMFFVKDIYRSCLLEKSVEFIVFLSANFSWFMLLCISIDRYFLVTKLNRYNAFMNISRMKALLVISFITANGLAVILLCTPSFPLQVLFNVANVVMMVFVSLVYVFIMRRLKKHHRNLQVLAKNASDKTRGRSESDKAIAEEDKRNAKETKNQLSALKTIQLLLVAIFALYGPYNIASTYRTYYKFGLKVNPVLALDVFVLWSYFIVLTNATINACIIIHGNSRTRRFVLSIIPCTSLSRNKIVVLNEGTSATETRLTKCNNRAKSDI